MPRRCPSATSCAGASGRMPRRLRPSPPAAKLDAGRARDLEELETRALEVLDQTPADLARARALVAAYQAYLGAALGSAQSTPRQTGRPGSGAAS